jgi:hypothetical protein
MTEASPPPSEKGEKQPRDAAFWARRIERLEVSDVPEGAANVNVQGRREVGALAEDLQGAPSRDRNDARRGRAGLEGALPRVPAAQ